MIKTDKLRELNEEYFELLGRVYENSEFLDEKIVNYITKQLFEKYKGELELLDMKNDIEFKQEFFTAKVRHGVKIPRRFFVFKNKTAKVRLKDLSAEFRAWLKAQENAYKARYGDGATTEPTAEGPVTSPPEVQETDEDGRQE